MLICANRCLALQFDLPGASFSRSPQIDQTLRKQKRPAVRGLFSPRGPLLFGPRNFWLELEA